MASETIVGIDLGTTNSEIAVVAGDSAGILEEEGSGILPSIVGLDPSGTFLVGEPARNQLLVAPERTVRSIKRKMGSAEKVRLGDLELTPAEIAAKILARLKERAERQLRETVRRAVITVPAFFDDAQRRATIAAAELAGLEVVRLLNEPTAAALAYETDLSRPRKLLVYDLGGGTFDVSIVEVEAGVVEVKASHGDTSLGGDDFDDLLLGHVSERFAAENAVDLGQSPRALARVRRAVERAKRALSTQPFARLDEEFLLEKNGALLNLSMEVSRAEYEELIRPLVDRTLESVQEALRRAGVLLGDLDGIVLVGGSTRTPLVYEVLKSRTGIEPRQDIHPDLCVALGAALQGGMIAGSRVNRVLVDITAHSFGVRCFGGENGERPHHDWYSRVIPRGATLPTTRSEVYSTMFPQQEAVDVDIYQGESPRVRDNTRIGRFRVEGLGELPRGNPIVVEFKLTLDGTLTVTATEKETGLSKNIVIDRSAPSQVDEGASRSVDFDVLGEVEPAGRTAESRDAQRPLESVDADRVRATVARVRGLFDSMTAEDRDEAADLVDRLEVDLEGGRLDDAKGALDELEEILFYVEER